MMAGWQERHLANENHAPLISRGSLLEQMQEDLRGLADHVHQEKRPLKGSNSSSSNTTISFQWQWFCSEGALTAVVRLQLQ